MCRKVYACVKSIKVFYKLSILGKAEVREGVKFCDEPNGLIKLMGACHYASLCTIINTR